jgi:ketosteroid isomerase-like protein
MSQENVEVVRRMYEDFNRTGKIDRGHLHADVVIRNVPGWVEQPRPGIEGADDWENMMSSAFDTVKFEIDEVLDVGGEQVVVVQRLSGRGRVSGMDVEMLAANVWTFRDDRVARIDSFADRASAVEAVGLRE